MKRQASFVLVMFCIAAAVIGIGFSSGGTAWAVPPVRAVASMDIPAAAVSPGVSERKVSGGKAYIRRLTFGADADSFSGAVTHERLIMVTEGSVTAASGGISWQLKAYDCVVVASGNRISYRSGGASELLEIGILPAESLPAPGYAGVPEYGAVFSYRELQFSFPGKDLPVKIIPIRGGMVAFERFGYNARRNLESADGRLSVVLRGEMSAECGRAVIQLDQGGALAIPPGGICEAVTDDESCELATVIASADARYIEALNRRMTMFHTIISPGTKPEIVVDGTTSQPGLTITEGPTWLDGTLFFSNYYMFSSEFGTRDEGGLCSWDRNRGYRVLSSKVQICGTTPFPGGSIGACDIYNGTVIEMSPDGTVLRTIADSFEGVPLGMPNDLITDSRGGFYFTDPQVGTDGTRKQPGTAVYYVGPEGGLRRVTGWNEYGFPNGCLVSPDGGVFYLSCSREPTVWMFDIEKDGSLSNKRPFTVLVEPDNPIDKDRRRGYSDGMTIDTDGNIYIATCFGVQVFNSEGGLLGTIVFPKSPAHCVFGGEDMSTLFATCGDMVYSIKTTRRGYQYPLK